jgi:hypothetical protein
MADTTIFSEQLGQYENQIQILPPAPADRSMEMLIGVADRLGGAILNKYQQSRDAKDRDKLMAGLQDEFTQLIEAHRQDPSKFTQTQLNTRIDARLREVRKNNPWRAAEIDTWIKEDLGLKPRGNTMNDQMQGLQAQRAAEEKTFQEAIENGIIVRDSKGAIDKDASTAKMQSIRAQMLQFQIENAAAQRKGTGGVEAERNAQRVAVSTGVQRIYDATVPVAINNLVHEGNELLAQGKNPADVMAMMDQRFNQLKTTFRTKVVHQARFGMDPSDFKTIDDMVEQDFNDQLTFIKGSGSSFNELQTRANYAVQFSQDEMRFLNPALVAAFGKDGVFNGQAAGDLLGGMKLANDPIIPSAGASISQVSRANDSKQITRLDKVLQNKTAIETMSAAAKAEPTKVDQMDPNTRAYLASVAARGLNTASKEILTPDRLSSFSASLGTAANLAGTSNNPGQMQAFLQKIDNPIMMRNIKSAVDAQPYGPVYKHAESIVQGVENAAKVAKKMTRDQALSWTSKVQSTLQDYGSMVYNAKTGQFEVEFNDAALAQKLEADKVLSYHQVFPVLSTVTDMIGEPMSVKASPVELQAMKTGILQEMEETTKEMNSTFRVYGTLSSVLKPGVSKEEYQQYLFQVYQNSGIMGSIMMKNGNTNLNADLKARLSGPAEGPKVRRMVKNPETGQYEEVKE